MPNSVTDLTRKPLFKFKMWFDVAPRTDTKEYMCLKQIELHAQNMITISQHNWGDLYDHLMNTSIFTLIMNKMFIWAVKITTAVSTSIRIC